jgi:aspartate/methionine/tyrosine aminotransferase
MTVSRLRDVPGIGVDRMGDAADAAADRAILRLENLDTDLRPPPAALAATRAAIDDDDANSYLPFLGHDALRQAAAAHVGRAANIDYDWRRSCVISAGGLSGILNVLLATLEPGDEVVLTDPIYVGLLNRVRIAGGVPKLVPLLPGPGGWRLDRDALAAAAGPRTRAVLMMSPSMPTGAVLTADEWEAVAALCRATGAWLIYDAAMERILYDGRAVIHPASLPGMAERTITIGAASKEYRMIGWRVGWVVGPPAIIADVGHVSIANVVTPVGIAQAAGAAALTASEHGGDDGIAAAVAEWQRRRDLIMHELDGLPVIPAHGGWSLLLDVAPLGLDGAEASRRLIDRARIAATPMVNWGSASAGRYVRFVFANEPCARLAGMGARVRAAL